MADEDGWLVKVQKLLAMAEDPGATPAEAEAFSRKAEAIMARYAITEAMLQAAGTKAEEPIVNVRFDIGDPYALVKRDLAFAVANTFSCRGVGHPGTRYVNGRRKRTQAMTVIGYQSDVDKVQMLLGSLFIQMSRALVHTPVPSHINARTFRTSLCIGFKDSVWIRLQAMKKQAVHESGSGTDLVLADRSSRVEAAQRDMFPNLTNVPFVKSRSMTGYRTGRVEGDRADIGLSRVGGERKALA